jgi:hypothetical protein
MASSHILATLLLLIAAFAGTFAYAQESGMKDTTSGGSLDVMVTPTGSLDNNTPTDFKVEFLKPDTDTVQVHIDYNFVIKKDGQPVFTATPQGQALLHTAEGVVTIPYKFEDTGDYTVEVSVAGINFTPISPETATFDVTVTPEFPAGALVAVAAVMGAAVVLSRRLKR